MGGQNFDRLPRGGAKYEEKKHFVCKNTKITIFQSQGRGQIPPLPTPK